MNKLSVLSTFGKGIAFPFREFSTVLRLTWLPLSILVVATYYFMREYIAALPLLIDGMNRGIAAPLPPGFQLLQFGFTFASLVIQGVIAAALYRVILFGDRRPGTVVYFRYGKAELFLTLAPVVIIFAVVLYSVLFSLVFRVVVGAAPGAMQSPENIGYAIAGLGTLFAFFLVWFLIRMSLWGPTIVAENRFAMTIASKVTKGNFWRLLGLFLLVLVALIAAELVLFAGLAAVYGPEFAQLLPETMETSDPQAALRFLEGLVVFGERHAIEFGALYIVLTFLLTAMAAGLFGHAYKSIRGEAAQDHTEQLS